MHSDRRHMMGRIDRARAGRHRRTWGSTVMAVATVVLAACSISFGDQLDLDDRRLTRGKLTGFEEGHLTFRTSSGEVVEVWIADVSRIFVDSVGGLDDFNAAERFIANDQTAQALPRYERAVRVVDDFWTDLIRARMLRAYDAMGRVDKAVQNFIRLMEGRFGGAAVAARLMPDNLPAQPTAAYRAAVKRLDDAALRLKRDDRLALVMLLRYDLIARAGETRIAGLAPAMARLQLPESALHDRPCRIQYKALTHVFKLGPTSDTYQWLDRAIRESVDSVVPDLLLLKARALLEGGTRKEEWVRAGWAFMRVVIHFKDDPAAAEGLLGAAQVYERIGRADKAITLLSECVDHASASEAVAQEARAALDRLRANISDDG